MKSKRILLRIGIGFVLVILLIKVGSFVIADPRLTKTNDAVKKVLDRQGRLLREIRPEVNPHRGFTQLSDISPHAIQATLFIEDKYFYWHPGFNPWSLLRAAFLNHEADRIVSGGSTITQQLARILLKRRSRSYSQKMRELIYALLLEARFSKDELLSFYLSLAPYGNELYGIEAASQVYFKKRAIDLNLAESIYLAGLVRSPTNYNPYIYPEKAVRKYESNCRRFAQFNQSYRTMVSNLVTPFIYPKERSYLAPHFVDYVLNHDDLEWDNDIITTSLDLSIQDRVQNLVTTELDRLRDKGVSQAAVLVLDTQSGEILAWVGSRNYWNNASEGQFNAVLAHRQPGSALKPFTYALYLEKGGSLGDVLADVKTSFDTDRGDYQPENYDRQFHGPVRVRVALGSSLNVPAVRVLSKVGVTSLYALLRGLNFTGLEEAASYYGLGLTLGNAEVSLLELTPAYATFLRKGYSLSPTFYAHRNPDVNQRQLFSATTSFMIADVLSDASARSLAFGVDGPLNFSYPVLAKTGTSSNHRDNWAFGVTPQYTVGVWAGNFNNEPMKGVSGVTGAAPLMHKIMALLMDGKADIWPTPPKELHTIEICPLSGMSRGPLCPQGSRELFLSSEQPQICDFHVAYKIDNRNGLLAGDSCPAEFVTEKMYTRYPDIYFAWARDHGLHEELPQPSPLCPLSKVVQTGNALKIMNPEEGDVYKIDPTIPLNSQKIYFRAQGGRPPYQWVLDGQVLKNVDGIVDWSLIKGEHELVLSDQSNSIKTHFEVR